jgi:GTP-binding protein
MSNLTSPRKEVRNLAIIAHVDHGKTTLLDGLLRQTGALPPKHAAAERVMDSEDLERERGITIHAKNTAIDYEGVHIHLVDTPGHADFGGEVERVLGMVDAVLLLACAVEGVMPQTRFVLRKALEHGLKPILVVNKIDRVEQRAPEVLNEVFDLLVDLGATDDQLDFPVIYASAKDATAAREANAPRRDLRPLLDAILEFVPPPDVDTEGPLQFQATTLDYDDFVGRLVIGRVERGCLRRGTTVVRIPESGAPQSFRITKLFGAYGLERREIESALAGDLVVIAGIDSIDVGDTICDPSCLESLPRIAIDPPTVRVRFSVNNSPFAGREGKFVTSRQIGERLRREVLGNVSIKIEDTDSPDVFEVAARGEMQIGVLVETMRREGYEFAVSRPEIISREIDGQNCEPVEEVVAEVPDTAAGIVMEKLSQRRGRLTSLEQRSGTTILQFLVPSRGLFGYRSEFLSDTRGEGILHRTVRGYEPFTGELPTRNVGAVMATEQGVTTQYALWKIQERCDLFVAPGTPCYEGQIIGQNRRPDDMSVHAARAKKLTNIRAAGKDEAMVLVPPRIHSIETALGWIADDELLEVTPVSLRLRKKILNASLRKR